MSDKPNDGGPAFPVPGNPATQPGMSLRDWFAGQALVALAARVSTSFAEDADDAFALADAMLKARNQTP